MKAHGVSQNSTFAVLCDTTLVHRMWARMCMGSCSSMVLHPSDIKTSSHDTPVQTETFTNAPSWVDGGVAVVRPATHWLRIPRIVLVYCRKRVVQRTRCFSPKGLSAQMGVRPWLWFLAQGSLVNGATGLRCSRILILIGFPFVTFNSYGLCL